MKNYFIGLFLSYAALYSLQYLCKQTIADKVSKGESNYFSSLNRIQYAASEPNDIVLVGSSIIGRLPGRESGIADVGNLGIDGGSTLDGLRVFDEKSIICRKLLVCEMNTILSPNAGSKLLSKGVNGVMFDLGCNFNHFAVGSRPSFMAYGYTIDKIRSGNNTFQINTSFTPNFKIYKDLPQISCNIDEMRLLTQVVKYIKKIRKSGINVVLVQFPASKLDDYEKKRVADAAQWISASSSVPCVDLEFQVPRNSLQFSDSVHLSPASAEFILSSLRNLNFSDTD